MRPGSPDSDIDTPRLAAQPPHRPPMFDLTDLRRPDLLLLIGMLIVLTLVAPAGLDALI